MFVGNGRFKRVRLVGSALKDKSASKKGNLQISSHIVLLLDTPRIRVFDPHRVYLGPVPKVVKLPSVRCRVGLAYISLL